MAIATNTSFDTVVHRLLSVPHPEGTFRVRQDELDVTDEFSELRFKDPRLGGYLDRSRIEECLSQMPLTIWLRESWNTEDLLSDSPLPVGAVERNRWTLIVPPRASSRLVSPRRSFAMVKAVIGHLAEGAPFLSSDRLVVGRTITLTAGGDGLIARLDWLHESAEINLARATGRDLGPVEQDWQCAPLPELLDRINGQIGR
ncbi:hypothetical protein LN042_22160 [Kitasatospora sp. RB6PN24]|uniref:hypothetical protein n=1 Tax=Kitasatospora humi TaxID=2893891 RepID=UPI001E6357A3|nr:hypothetical protein [Kitasatospora humi]MCC9309744.1 hypothetical protein [Kitasatospora humi]